MRNLKTSFTVYSSVNQSRLSVLPWVLVGVLGTLLLTKSDHKAAQQQTSSTLPMLVKSIRDIGFLQSKEVNLQESFKLATSKQAADWARLIPGAESVVQSVTKNEVSVTASGKVTAGFDLRDAKISYEGDTVLVKLPKVVVSRADVDVEVQSRKHGTLWRDEDISLKAVDEARSRFRGAAKRLQIESEAFASAKSRLSELLGKVTPKRVVIERA